ncbi:histidine phosphatase family protein [Haloplasma contractile]|uniref:Phosphoglycerate mutase protein n=1 Tax=Haloplasma contractile SSD-17B TaxID=1033810 RepID=U2FGI8_9MOLU|nr:histidine phosphatase family protein [Haloplasma contractile]ERJ11985.1 phosphoglycerate mutase protein [Haloplasma contractile SSD-17B]
MKIYLTRHGKTEWNEAGKLQGQKDSALVEDGINNAKKLNKRLKNITFGCIYSSPLKRAFDTACYIRGEKDTPIVIKDSIKEMNFGSWEGVHHSIIKEEYTKDYDYFWNKPHLYEAKSGEGFNELIERVKRALTEIINETKSESILIVTHTVVIKAIYAIIEERTLDTFWDLPFIHDTSLTIIEVHEDRYTITLRADTTHLK